MFALQGSVRINICARPRSRRINFAVSWPRENVAEIDFPSNSSDSLRLCKRRGNEEIHLSGTRFSLRPPVNWLTIYGWGVHRYDGIVDVHKYYFLLP